MYCDYNEFKNKYKLAMQDKYAQILISRNCSIDSNSGGITRVDYGVHKWSLLKIKDNHVIQKKTIQIIKEPIIKKKPVNRIFF